MADQNWSNSPVEALPACTPIALPLAHSPREVEAVRYSVRQRVIYLKALLLRKWVDEWVEKPPCSQPPANGFVDDGEYRWQDIFTGSDSGLMGQPGQEISLYGIGIRCYRLPADLR